MFYIHKPNQKKDIIIRPATAADLYNYKKNKGMFGNSDNTDLENKIPNKDCHCDHKFELEDFFANEYFFINCELGASDIKEKD